MKICRLVVAILWWAGAAAGAQTSAASPPAHRLAGLINGFRVAQGRTAMPVSPLLTEVEQAHVQDLDQALPTGRCNGQSCSSVGDWRACCYTIDQAQAHCMWGKPGESARGAYPVPGFEIDFWAGGNATLEMAFERWKGGAGHFDVILYRGVWSHLRRQTMGMGMGMGMAESAHHAAVWFGGSLDAVVD